MRRIKYVPSRNYAVYFRVYDPMSPSTSANQQRKVIVKAQTMANALLLSNQVISDYIQTYNSQNVYPLPYNWIIDGIILQN